MGSSKSDHEKATSSSNDKAVEEEAISLFAWYLSSAAVLPMVLKSAIELDIFEIIKAAGPASAFSAAELVAKLPTSNPEAPAMLDRVLRLLANHSILNCSTTTLPGGVVERRYSLAPVCKYLTKNEDGVSLAPLIVMDNDKIFMESWFHLKDSILEGGTPFKRAHGMTIFEYAGTDAKFNMTFNQAMSNHSTILVKNILELYKGFEGLQSLVDVAGGTGATLNMITTKYPSIKGINFDLPHVVQRAPLYSGIEHIGGDMFVSIPKADAIFLKSILHNWSEAQCVKILKNCYESLPQNGKVIVVEIPLSETTDQVPNDIGLHVDLLMLACSPSSDSRERTAKEFEALATQASFKELRKVCFVAPFWIMELYK